MNLPAPFEQSMHQLLGNDYEAFRKALLDEPAVSIRINRNKWNLATSYEPVPWATDGYYLPNRPQFTFDPVFHGGGYYVQEASSMFVEQAVKQHLGEAHVALDLCAAPGGKSTLLRSLLPDECVLVSNEPIRPRAQVLAENITKWGHPRCIVTSNFPTDFTAFSELFDLILVDAPCSGEGMFRKDEIAVSEWSPENVKVCWQRQRDILSEIWPTLRSGGLLIYSTCTFNTDEDEENVRWMVDELGAELLPIDIAPTWGITRSLVPSVKHVYRFLPGRTRGEGFFLAILRKNGNFSPVKMTDTKRRSPAKKNKGKQSLVIPTECKQWLTEADSYKNKLVETEVQAIPADIEPLTVTLSEHLHLLKAGITLAELKGCNAIPSHELALSTAINLTAFPISELSYGEALRYLHKEAITLAPNVPRGFVIVTYRGIPLGYVKNLGNRANNLYPNEWRIRSGHFPESEVKIL